MTIFEILGATHLENCYSWLINHAFKASREFQEGLIRALDDSPDVPTEGWECKAQLPVRIYGRMQYPDLAFYHEATRRLILVEVKTHAGEGAGQSRSYSSPDFLQACCKELFAPVLGPTYRWLTPDGWRPEAELFQPVTFSRVAAALRQCTFPEPGLSLLVCDFVALVNELENRDPLPDLSVREFLRGRRLLTYERNLECFSRALQVGGIGTPTPVRQALISNDPATGIRLNCPYYQWILREGDVALELAVQGEQNADPTALTMKFQYHCWGKQRQHEKEEPGWTQRYAAARRAYINRLSCHMDQLKHYGWQRSSGGAYAIARKALGATEPCSKVIEDANQAIAELLRILEGLGDPCDGVDAITPLLVPSF